MKDPLEESTVEMTRGGATRFLVAFVAALVGLAVFVPGSRIPLAIIVGIVLMVMLHEAGHYITAKRRYEGHRVLPRVRAAPVVVPAR